MKLVNQGKGMENNLNLNLKCGKLIKLQINITMTDFMTTGHDV